MKLLFLVICFALFLLCNCNNNNREENIVVNNVKEEIEYYLFIEEWGGNVLKYASFPSFPFSFNL
jgi:hypothetical protein